VKLFPLFRLDTVRSNHIPLDSDTRHCPVVTDELRYLHGRHQTAGDPQLGMHWRSLSSFVGHLRRRATSSGLRGAKGRAAGAVGLTSWGAPGSPSSSGGHARPGAGRWESPDRHPATDENFSYDLTRGGVARHLLGRASSRGQGSGDRSSKRPG